jgi:hypothetical protein
LLIIRPGADSFHWAMFLSLGVAVIAALYQITTRKIGGQGSGAGVAFAVNAGGQRARHADGRGPVAAARP